MQNQQQSRLGVLVGPDFDGQGKWSMSFEATFTQQKAAEQLEKLKQLTDGALDLEWSWVISLQAAPGQAQKLNEGIQAALKSFQDNEELPIQVKTVVEADRLLMSIKGTPDIEADYLEPFNMFYNQGLEQISNEQRNSIKGDVRSNFPLQAVLESLQNGERVLSAVLKSLKVELLFDLNTALADNLKQLIENFDPEFANEPPMVFFKKFRSFDVDVQFKNTDELPQAIKNKVLFGKKLQKQIAENPGEAAFKEEMLPGSTQIMEAIGEEHEIWGTIPNFVAFNAKACTPGLSQLIKLYGLGFADLF